MIGPPAVSANQLASEVGIGQPTLSRWLREAKLAPVAKKKSRREPRKQWTPEEKLRVVGEAAHVGEEGLGALLRREGLHEADLERFRRELLEGLRETTARSRKTTMEAKRVKELERELRRKEKALAETAALLVLRKKAEAFFSGEEEGDTDEKNGR
jgi:transposase-like protein